MRSLCFSSLCASESIRRSIGLQFHLSYFNFSPYAYLLNKLSLASYLSYLMLHKLHTHVTHPEVFNVSVDCRTTQSLQTTDWYNFRNGGTERLRLVPDFTRV